MVPIISSCSSSDESSSNAIVPITITISIFQLKVLKTHAAPELKSLYVALENFPTLSSEEEHAFLDDDTMAKKWDKAITQVVDDSVEIMARVLKVVKNEHVSQSAIRKLMRILTGRIYSNAQLEHLWSHLGKSIEETTGVTLVESEVTTANGESKPLVLPLSPWPL